MPKVLCFKCGNEFNIDYGISNPTKRCPKCLDKIQDTYISFLLRKE